MSINFWRNTRNDDISKEFSTLWKNTLFVRFCKYPFPQEHPHPFFAKDLIWYQALLWLVPPHWGTMWRGELFKEDWFGGAPELCKEENFSQRISVNFGAPPTQSSFNSSPPHIVPQWGGTNHKRAWYQIRSLAKNGQSSAQFYPGPGNIIPNRIPLTRLY